MSDGFEYGRYRRYLSVAAEDLELVECDSLQEARSGRGLRLLSSSEFENLLSTAAQDVGLQQRWRERLAWGYHREKSRIGDAIEEFFVQVPIDDRSANTHERAA